MGAYINPFRESKEHFLMRCGSAISKVTAQNNGVLRPFSDKLLVALIQNDQYSAALIVVSQYDHDCVFNPSESRSAQFFMVDILALHTVCNDLHDYLHEPPSEFAKFVKELPDQRP